VISVGVVIQRSSHQTMKRWHAGSRGISCSILPEEWEALRSQFATSNEPTRGGRRYAPFVFTEHGAIMAATVLNSPRAVEVSIYVVRAFVQLRELLAGHKELAQPLDRLEARMERKLLTQDQAIAGILDAIRQLMAPPPAPKKRPIGFVTGDGKT